jgi:hypothetical protein
MQFQIMQKLRVRDVLHDIFEQQADTLRGRSASSARFWKRSLTGLSTWPTGATKPRRTLSSA